MSQDTCRMSFTRRSSGPMNTAPDSENEERRPCASWMRPVLIHPDEACKLGFAHGLGFWAAGVVVSAVLAMVGVEGYELVSGRRLFCPTSTDNVSSAVARLAFSSAPAAADAAAPIIDDTIINDDNADAVIIDAAALINIIIDDAITNDNDADAVSVSRLDPCLYE